MSLLTSAGARGTPETGETEATPSAGLIAGYDAGAFFDEMIEGSGSLDPTTARCTSGSRR